MINYDERGKAALVTGGERGIGKGIVLRLAEAGYDVAFTYYFSSEKAEEVKNMVEKMGRKCVTLEADFRNAKAAETVIKEAAKGLGRLDLVVNNAAIMPPRLYQYEYTADHIDEVLSVNYRGYMLIMRDAIRYWIKGGTKGSIVNINSESAIRSHQKFSLYGGIKAAILRSSANAALDAAPYGIRINCVLPGCIDTISGEAVEEGRVLKEEAEHREKFARTNIPLQRQGTAREIGNAVLWLASDEAAYITGANLTVDGGITLPGLTDMTVEPDEIAYGMCTKRQVTMQEMEAW
jgi:NAD(P)-dependent dehydrogenase (short-subunit alcohol dehydrogenase family)